MQNNISKIIYYCWFGGEKPQKVIDCINNWMEMLPDYQIIEINDKNKSLFDIEKECENNLWFKTCFENKLWAYVSDYARLKVLYENGGVYFDTDITVEKNIDELLCKKKLILGFEDFSSINVAIAIVNKGNPILKEMLDFYNDEIWKTKLYTIPHVATYILRKNYKLLSSKKITETENVIIYPQEYFYPIPVGMKIRNEDINHFKTNNTFTIHWNDGNWSSNRFYAGRDFFSKNKHKIELKKLLEYCFHEKIIIDTPFLKISKTCSFWDIHIDFYWLFRFKYRYDLNKKRWLVVYIFGHPIKLFICSGENK